MHPSAKKIAIMQAAAKLFAARGYDVVTVRDIASVMDMTPASLYYYFPDKENLYRQTLLMVFMGGKTAFQHIAGETEIQKIESLIRNIVIYCFTNPIFSRLLLRELNEGQEERLRFLAAMSSPHCAARRGRSCPHTAYRMPTISPNALKVLFWAICSFTGSRVFSRTIKSARLTSSPSLGKYSALSANS